MSDFDLAVRRWREQAMHNAMRRMPPALCSKIGSYMGANVGPKIDPGGDRAVRAVVRLVRPDLEGAAHEAAVHRIWANIGRVFAEFSVLPKLLGRTELVGEDIAREVFSDPRPLIVVYPHLANWEVLGALLCIHPAARDRRKCAIYAPQDDPVRAAIAEQCRAQFPADLIPQGPRIWKQFRERLHEPRGSVFAPVDT